MSEPSRSRARASAKRTARATPSERARVVTSGQCMVPFWVSAMDVQEGSTRHDGRTHEQVQVTAGPQREVTIDMNGETQPHEGDHRKVVPGHQLEQRQ